jgi:hypothetical protein
MSINAFGTEGVPSFQFMSTNNDPTDKNLTFNSDDALFFKVTDMQNNFIGQFASPNGSGPYQATGGIFPNTPYPTIANVDVYDKATFKYLGQGQINLNGGDVYKVRVTYKEYVPIANGFVSVMMNGERMIVPGQSYGRLPYDNDDVIPRGSGEG